MQPIECAVIAAAGLGSRLGHGIPKCMLEIDGKTLLSRLIESLRCLVPRIHVVVGYREEMIIELCARSHRDVVIVRNPEFRTTNTGESMSLGARACRGKTLFLDGDLLIHPTSISKFIQSASSFDILVGITPTRSEQPVCVGYTTSPGEDNDNLIVEYFSRESWSSYEWANVVAGPRSLMDGVPGYVFERLASQTPLPAMEIDLREVDTATDLEAARAFAREMAKDSQPKDFILNP